MVRLAHSLAFVCLGKFVELVVLLKFSVHDGFDAFHVFSRLRALELLVTKQSKFVEDLTGPRTVLFTFEFTNSWLQVVFHDCVRLCKASFSKMVTLLLLAAIRS
jgi:hypothetical protein